MAAMTGAFIDWAVQTRALPGQSECGDRYAALSLKRRALLAVVDGVGHGEQAAAAATEAADTILRHGASESLVSLVRLCHGRLARGRGVVMSLAEIDAGARKLGWLGVGNVAGVLRRRFGAFSRKHETLLLRAGVVGKQLPALQAATVPVARGDLLILATDGIEEDFAEDLHLDWPPQRIADDVLARYAKRSDDALVLVARYLG
jgi:serine phosphatase RsbU (regulator of sigma subunit)